MGIPAKLHFRLAVEQLGEWLSRRIGRACARVDWDDAAALAELLGPTLAYHRTLAAVAGGVNAGLLLSRALHLTRLQSKRQSDGWFSRSIPQWTEELGLTRREQERARRALAGAGLWEEEIGRDAGPPRRSHPNRRASGTARRVRWRRTRGSAPGARCPSPRLRQSRNQPCTKRRNKYAGIPHSCFAKSA